MRRSIYLVIFTAISLLANAQSRKALVIGINTYSAPPGIKPESGAERFEFADLDGARNDAEVIHATLVNKYGFNAADTRLLLDRHATRDSILMALGQLLSQCNAGDFAVFYYAGHGSQVKNSASAELDKKDETIVPSDAWRREGMDITDKELGRYFNQFIDKGVILTVIFDCCHSGSLSRGSSFAKSKSRAIKPANFDTKDNSIQYAPEQRKEGTFLIVSASQDNESAVEQLDDQNIPHGSFTIALIQSLYQQPADRSVQDLFNSTRAILKLNGKRQEPVLAATSQRRNQTFLGLPTSSVSEKIKVPINPIFGKKVEILAGHANFIQKDNEFVAAINSSEGNTDSVFVRVDSVLSLTKSAGTVVRGNSALIRGGELFELTNWVSSSTPLLKIYIPPTLSPTAITTQQAQLMELRKAKAGTSITDLEKNDPDFFIQPVNNELYLLNSSGNQVLRAATVALLVPRLQKKKYFYNLNPVSELATILRTRLSKGTGITVVDKPSEAQYYLYGTLTGKNELAYGFMRMETTANDSLESMPVQTKGVLWKANTPGSIADSLYEQAMRLAKVRGWLSLSPPKASTAFPFQLKLLNIKTGKLTDSAGVKINDEVELQIHANSQAKYTSIAQKYIYSFAIDKHGTMTLLYPDENLGNSDNKFPRYNAGKLVEQITLSRFEIGEPAGTDSYFLIACDEPIQNYEKVFQQTGIRSVGNNTNHPIVQLLNLGNEGQLRGLKKSPINWQLLRMTVRSAH